MRKRKKNRYTKREKGILSSILLGDPIYIKNTGVEISILQIDKDYYRKIPYIHAQFKDNPTADILLDSAEFRLHNNKGGGRLGNNIVQLPNEPLYQGQIQLTLDRLSTSPYETRAAKILYKRKK